jgi:hypothetical protein
MPLNKSNPPLTLNTELLTEQQAAEILNYSPRTLQLWRRKGGGPRYIKSHFGRSGGIRYRREDLKEWMTSHTLTNTSDPGEPTLQAIPARAARRVRQ